MTATSTLSSFTMANGKLKMMASFLPAIAQEEALLDALNAARRLDRKGQDAEVLTQGADFRFRTEWTNRLERLQHESAKARRHN